MFSGLNRFTRRIPVTLRMMLLSATVFIILMGTILFILNIMKEREWSAQNQKKIDQVVTTILAQYPDLEQAELLLSNQTVQFSLSRFSDGENVYRSRLMPAFFSPGHDDGPPDEWGNFFDQQDDDMEDGPANGIHWAASTRHLVLGDETFILQVAVNREAEFFSDDLFQTLAAVLIPLFLIASFISTFISQRRSLQQIERISQAAEEISASSLERKIPDFGSNDELGHLTIQFNSMIDRLRLGMEEQKRFTADASHELRTPLASLSGYINMLERWGMEDSEIRTEAVSVIRKECSYMNRLIENLLMLSRLDGGSIPMEFRGFESSRLLGSVKTRMEMAFPGRELHLINKTSGQIYGNPETLEQVLQILDENSFLYDKGADPVILVAGIKDSGFFLAVKDNGPGIPEEEFQNVFNRFYRIDKVRTRETGGTGLGLSLAKEIIQLHGGSIKFCHRRRGALCLIQLPAAGCGKL